MITFILYYFLIYILKIIIKTIERFEKFNEGLRDKLKANSEEDIKDKLSTYTEVLNNGLAMSYLPPIDTWEAIMGFMSALNSCKVLYNGSERNIIFRFESGYHYGGEYHMSIGLNSEYGTKFIVTHTKDDMFILFKETIDKMVKWIERMSVKIIK